MIELHAIFYGQVHGVGFRATSERIASQFALSGYVRNVSDGSVEIKAYGNKETLSHFLETLQSLFSKKIDRVEISYREYAAPSYRSFEIR